MTTEALQTALAAAVENHWPDEGPLFAIVGGDKCFAHDAWADHYWIVPKEINNPIRMALLSNSAEAFFRRRMEVLYKEFNKTAGVMYARELSDFEHGNKDLRQADESAEAWAAVHRAALEEGK